MRKGGNPGSVSAAKSSLSVAQVRVMFWVKHMLHIVLLLLTPARDWRFLLFPECTGACAGSRSRCPCSALNHVFGSFAGAAILGMQIFVHFNKGLSLLIHPVNVLFKIQILTLSGTWNVWDIWKKSNALLLQPYSPIICLYNDLCHLFCFFTSPCHSLINPLPIYTCLSLSGFRYCAFTCTGLEFSNFQLVQGHGLSGFIVLG